MSGAANPVAEQVSQKTTEIESKIQEFFRQINDVLSSVPDFLSHLIEPIKQGLQEVNAKLQQFWSEINKFLISQRGEPGTLEDAAQQWVNDVGNPVQKIADEIEMQNFRTHIEWTGRAAAAYKTIVPAQAEGLKGIEDLTGQLRTSLKKLADGIDSFWSAMLWALIGFLGAIILAIGEACSVIAAPAAPITLGVGALAAITLIGTAVMEAKSLSDTLDSEQTAINEKIRDLGNQWDRAKVDLGDATTTDGDQSNWEAR